MDLVLQNIAKRYGTDWVLKRIDLTVKEGEFFSLLGGSGSGKTTFSAAAHHCSNFLKMVANMQLYGISFQTNSPAQISLWWAYRVY